MPKRKTLSNDIKQCIVKAVENGESTRDVGSRFGVTHSAVVKIHKKWSIRGSVERPKVKGRPTKLSKRHVRQLIRPVKENPHLNSTDVRKAASAQFDIHISKWTAQRMLT